MSLYLLTADEAKGLTGRSSPRFMDLSPPLPGPVLPPPAGVNIAH